MSEAVKHRLKKVELINNALQQYIGGEHEKILASELMPELIAKGVYEKDYNNGLPIRKFLEELASENQLHQIPFAKLLGGRWYFVFHESRKYNKKDSDENYVINLCDKVLKEKAARQHKFDFLQSDITKSGKKINLPVDAFYPSYSLVVEYLEDYHFEGVLKRRKNYDERRRYILPKNGIKLLEIEFLSFAYDSKFRIIRREEKDYELVKGLLINIVSPFVL